MKNIPLFIFILILYSAFVSAQEVPDWVENKGLSKWYSEDSYLTGFGISSYTKNDKLSSINQIAEENAKKNLSEKILVQVKSLTRSLKEQDGYYFTQKLESEVISISEIELLGLKREFYTDHKKNLVYCLVYVPKSYLIKSYDFKAFEKTNELESLYYAAREYEKNGQKDKALESYLNCYPLISNINDFQNVLLGLGKLPENEVVIDKADLVHSINKLVTTINSLNDLAFFIAYVFQEQTRDEILSGVIVSPLTYRNTGMSSMFSKQFKESVEHHLITHNKWETYPIKKYDPTIENMNTIKYAVKGSYWDTEDKITINIYVSEILTGIKKASIEYQFDRSLIDEDYTPIQPDNFLLAKGDMDIFNNKEIKTNGLFLNVYTNKGQEDLIFYEGEKMKIYLKVNMPCYIRLIYHLNDSSRILLLNNEFIAADQVNKIYELPFTFICREPFGVETLQVNARESRFPDIKQYEKNGMVYIDESLPDIIENVRGNDKYIMQAEKRLTITTMPN